MHWVCGINCQKKTFFYLEPRPVQTTYFFFFFFLPNLPFSLVVSAFMYLSLLGVSVPRLPLAQIWHLFSIRSWAITTQPWPSYSLRINTSLKSVFQLPLIFYFWQFLSLFWTLFYAFQRAFSLCFQLLYLISQISIRLLRNDKYFSFEETFICSSANLWASLVFLLLN